MYYQNKNKMNYSDLYSKPHRDSFIECLEHDRYENVGGAISYTCSRSSNDMVIGFDKEKTYYPSHLYIIGQHYSNIKIGDVLIKSIDRAAGRAIFHKLKTDEDVEKYKNNGNYDIVFATTNLQLNIPLISDDFVKLYVHHRSNHITTISSVRFFINEENNAVILNPVKKFDYQMELAIKNSLRHFGHDDESINKYIVNEFYI